VLSTSKHPQTDGQTEVMNQQLKTTLCVYVQADQKDWAAWLDVLQLAYNNAMHSSHKSSPAQLLLGYKPRTLLDFLTNEDQAVTEGHIGLRTCVEELKVHWDAVRDAIQRSADQQAYQYDKGHCVPMLKVGDKVLINPHSLELHLLTEELHNAARWLQH
jgi:hypothetical protein